MVRASTLGKTLLQMVEDSTDSIDEVVERFVRFVQKRNLVYVLPQVVRYLESVEANSKQGREVCITTRGDVPSDILDVIKKEVSAPNDAPVVHRKDPQLLGGFKARYNNVLYDASIQRNLRRLRRELVQ